MTAMLRPRADEPIARSLLDTDFYKFTMGHFIFHKHKDVHAKFAYTNRTRSTQLASIIPIDQLREQLDHARTLRFHPYELEYLESLKNGEAPMFCKEYIDFLAGYQLPEYHLEARNGDIVLETEGPWHESTYWEIPALFIISELFNLNIAKGFSPGNWREVVQEGEDRLTGKMDILCWPFIDFGTRRRFGREWHRFSIEWMLENYPEKLSGTSNPMYAWTFGLEPKGTIAHEVHMGYAGMAPQTDEGIRNSQNLLLLDWWDMYGAGLSVALTDTYGTDFFFRDMTAEQAANWKGLRHDSGSPIEFGEKAIRFYEDHGIDPREKFLLYSDGLNVPKINEIAHHFLGGGKRIGVAPPGMGTNFTNDVGFSNISQVMKLVEANGNSLVKLSDNSAKAVGPPKLVERYKKIFGVEHQAFERLKY